ncbi:MAG: hypothetical protein NVSMB45_04390 [Ginsengibacter sp.]
MTESIVPISQRETYHPSDITKFLWWLSTAEKELLEDSIVDRNRYRIIGTTVLATWLFATLAWSYFFSTVIQNGFLIALLGLFMGFVILTIDRALIKGISKYNKNKIFPLLLRGLLALTIGVFMAQPALLFMFNKEIKLQTMLDNEKRKKEKSDDLTTLYKVKRDQFIVEKNSLQSALNLKNNEVNAARQAFIAEADGSGGTGKIGIKNIAIAKKAEYDKLDGEYKILLAADLPKIEEADKQLKDINANITKEESAFAENFNDGFLTRIEALNNLIKTSPALQFRYYLLVTILMLIELMPVIAKTLLPSGVYDEKVKLREEMENKMLVTNTQNELEVKEHYSNAAKEFDKDSIDVFFAAVKSEKAGKIQSYTDEWKNDRDQSIDGLWARMKKQVLTKNEN